MPQKDLDSAKKVQLQNFCGLCMICCCIQIKLVVVKMEQESNCDTRDQMVRVQEQIAEVRLRKQKPLLILTLVKG